MCPTKIIICDRPEKEVKKDYLLKGKVCFGHLGPKKTQVMKGLTYFSLLLYSSPERYFRFYWLLLETDDKLVRLL